VRWPRITQTLTDERSACWQDEFDRRIEVLSAADDEPKDAVFTDADEDLARGRAVVTIMGHVDHGKTSLPTRSARPRSRRRSGRITQHIGAYQVHHGERIVTFLDTPRATRRSRRCAPASEGHDIAVIVVAADRRC